MNKIELVSFYDTNIKFIDGDRGENYPKRNELKPQGDCLFLNTGNVTKSGFDFSETQFISSVKDDQLRNGKVSKNDIVMTTRGTVGNVAFVDENVPFSSIRINSGMVIIRCEEKYSPYFLYSFFRSNLFKQQCLNQGSGSAQPQLPISTLKSIKFPNFELKQQVKIAKIIKNIDEYILINNKISKLLNTLIQKIFNFWFVDYNFPNDLGKPFKLSQGKIIYDEIMKRYIPENWKIETLNNIAEIVGGATPSTKDSSNFTTNGIPWITPNDLSNNKNNIYISKGATDITEKGFKSASLKMYPKNTILLSSRAPIGYMAIADNEVTTNQGFKSFVPSKGYSCYFIFCIINSNLNVIKQSASGSTFKEISGSVLKSIRVVLPPRTLVEKFDVIVAPMFKKQNFLEEQNQRLERLRDWILPMLMTGQISIRDAEEHIGKTFEQNE